MLGDGAPAAAVLGEIDVVLKSVPVGLGCGAAEADRSGLTERGFGAFCREAITPATIPAASLAAFPFDGFWKVPGAGAGVFCGTDDTGEGPVAWRTCVGVSAGSLNGSVELLG